MSHAVASQGDWISLAAAGLDDGGGDGTLGLEWCGSERKRGQLRGEGGVEERVDGATGLAGRAGDGIVPGPDAVPRGGEEVQD